MVLTRSRHRYHRVLTHIAICNLDMKYALSRNIPAAGALMKKENQIFLIFKKIQKGAVATGLLICGEIFANFLINKETFPHI
jgi:hypothetical protein